MDFNNAKNTLSKSVYFLRYIKSLRQSDRFKRLFQKSQSILETPLQTSPRSGERL